MVCDYCGSAAHVTGYKDCPNYCTVCAAPGHKRKTNACPNLSVPSARPPDITHARALSAIRAKQIMRRTSVRISNAHIAKSTVMMQSKRCPEKPTPLCYACGSSTHQTPRSVDCSEHKCATCQGELEPKGHNHKNCPLAQCDACNLSGHIGCVAGCVHLSTMLRRGS